MKREVKYITEVIAITAFHFGTTYFAVRALFPSFALQAATIAVFIALLAYLFLVLTNNADEGLPIGLLYLFPIIYLTAGVI